MRRGPLGAAVLAAAVLAAAVLGACSDGEAGPRVDNVLLFSIDTLRPDLLGCYGNTGARTPAVDALADEGLLFERAYAQATMTNPSLTSILTGLMPPEHAVHDQTSGFAEGVVSLPMLAADAGIATGSFIANMCQLQNAPNTVWSDGWDEQFCGIMDDPENYSDQYLWDAAVVDAGLGWIAEQDGPWLAWLHLMDPHGEHRPPPHLWDYAARPVRSAHDQYEFYNTLEAEQRMPDPEVYAELWALYTAEVEGSDEQFARVLEALRTRADWDRTALIYFSDHGEELFETIPRSGHGLVMTDGVLRVPLIVRAPGVAPGVVPGPVEAAQIMPTALALLGLETPYELDAQSLLSASPSRGYAMSYGNRVTTSVRGSTHRLWRRSTNRPFVREYAPWKTASPWFQERESLVVYESPDSAVPTWLDPDDPSKRRVKRRLERQIVRRTEELVPFGPPTRVDDEELMEHLRRAGYIDPLEVGGATEEP